MNFNNLHALASTVIPQQSMSWIRFKENSENAMGVTVPVYHDPETIGGSLQPMDVKTAAIQVLTQAGTERNAITCEIWEVHP